MNRFLLCASFAIILGSAQPAVAAVTFMNADSDSHPSPAPPAAIRNYWGVDLLVSTGGFGLGTFYRREFDPDLCGFVDFSVSEAADEREVTQFDYYGQPYITGKLNRFFVLPLMAGVQYRLFREDIVDSFRPFVNAAVGPTLIYMSPYAEFVNNADGTSSAQQVEFFHSLGRGTPHYTASAYIGLGANFGSERTSVYGVNFRYYFTYLLGDGLPSMYDPNTFALSSRKKDFGGFFITLNIGLGY
jgi:hypothetical protein